MAMNKGTPQRVYNDLSQQLVVEYIPTDAAIYRIYAKDSDVPLLEIPFQTGAINEHGLNGASLESVLAVIIHRLETLNVSPFKSVFNRQALNHLQSAIKMLENRTLDREHRGVEGTMNP